VSKQSHKSFEASLSKRESAVAQTKKKKKSVVSFFTQADLFQFSTFVYATTLKKERQSEVKQV
jgi:hypothetical protein